MSDPKIIEDAEIETQLRELVDAIFGDTRLRMLAVVDQMFAVSGEVGSKAVAKGYTLGRTTTASGLTAWFLHAIHEVRGAGGGLDDLEAVVKGAWPAIEKGAKT